MTLPFIRNSLSLLKVLLLSPHIQVDNKKHLNQEKLQGCLGSERERAILCWHKALLLSGRLQLVLFFCEAFWMVSPWCFPYRQGPLILFDCLLAARVYLAINVVYFNFVASYCSRSLFELLWMFRTLNIKKKKNNSHYMTFFLNRGFFTKLKITTYFLSSLFLQQ